MKKLFAAAGLLALSVGAFGGVAAQDGFACPEGDAEIVVAAGAVGAELEVFNEQAARYMELCPNITVTALETPDLATDRLGLYQQFWEAQSADVDVFQVDVIWAGIAAPHAVDMNEYLSDEYIAQFFPDMIAGQTVGDKLVAIPWFTDAAGLYYRTDLLEKYGVEVPTTWDELTVAAQTIADGERAEGNAEFQGYVWQGNAYEGLTCDAHEWLVAETGESFITADGEVNVNNEAFIAAIERAAGWVGTISPEGVTTYGEEDSREVWQSGNAAFMRNWPYAYGLGNGEDSAVAGLFGYAPLPMGAVRSGACLGGWQLMASSYSDNPAAAASVAEFLASYDEQMARALSPQGANPTIPALYETEELLASPLFAAMGPILETAYPRPSSITAERYNTASTIFFSGVHDVLTGVTDAQTAVEDMEADLMDLMAG
ncbi:MAG: ABC transporter substrate-binding protein [Pleurocapsa minor GSE-CHR-MK-17-07R]|jgi:trehalose/maltose transport system substrate-binding protein|nr:ABC transporter substrate-binding protein [Pleurocapsa minor GSE-CHR-MK 17-07R]